MSNLRGKVNGAHVLVMWEDEGKNKTSKIITKKDKTQNSGIVVAVGNGVENKDIVPGTEVFWSTNDQITVMSIRRVDVDGVSYLAVREDTVLVYREPETNEKTE